MWEGNGSSWLVLMHQILKGECFIDHVFCKLFELLPLPFLSVTTTTAVLRIALQVISELPSFIIQ